MSGIQIPRVFFLFAVLAAAVAVAAVDGRAAVVGEQRIGQTGAQEPQIGWYMRPGGEAVLVSPGPGGGYRRLSFANADFASLKVGTGADDFRWLPPGQGGPALVSPEGERWLPWSDAPYTLEEVVFQSSDSTRLGGLLLLPRKPPTRGAVMVHGSGTSDRDNAWHTRSRMPSRNPA